jgi:hypothetical protein
MKKVINYKYKYSESVLKSSEGGPGTSTLKSVFKGKSNGIDTYFGSSCFVGHTSYTIYAANLAKLKEAYKTLRSYGYGDSSWNRFKRNAIAI